MVSQELIVDTYKVKQSSVDGWTNSGHTIGRPINISKIDVAINENTTKLKRGLIDIHQFLKNLIFVTKNFLEPASSSDANNALDAANNNNNDENIDDLDGNNEDDFIDDDGEDDTTGKHLCQRGSRCLMMNVLYS